jgi:hypothetical protein
MSFNPCRRSAVGSILMALLIVNVGCRGWIEKSIVPDTGTGTPQTSLLRVTKTDGAVVTLRDFVVRNDSIVGFFAAGPRLRTAVARTHVTKNRGERRYHAPRGTDRGEDLPGGPCGRRARVSRYGDNVRQRRQSTAPLNATRQAASGVGVQIAAPTDEEHRAPSKCVCVLYSYRGRVTGIQFSLCQAEPRMAPPNPPRAAPKTPCEILCIPLNSLPGALDPSMAPVIAPTSNPIPAAPQVCL